MAGLREISQIDIEERLNEARRRVDELKAQQSALSKAMQSAIQEMADYEKELTRRCGNLIVTDHAVIRYLERVMGIDIELVKLQISTPFLREASQTLGDGRYPLDPQNSHVAAVKDMKIITVI